MSQNSQVDSELAYVSCGAVIALSPHVKTLMAILSDRVAAACFVSLSPAKTFLAIVAAMDSGLIEPVTLESGTWQDRVNSPSFVYGVAEHVRVCGNDMKSLVEQRWNDARGYEISVIGEMEFAVQEYVARWNEALSPLSIHSARSLRIRLSAGSADLDPEDAVILSHVTREVSGLMRRTVDEQAVLHAMFSVGQEQITSIIRSGGRMFEIRNPHSFEFIKSLAEHLKTDY